jgi:hypothetical protein
MPRRNSIRSSQLRAQSRIRQVETARARGLRSATRQCRTAMYHSLRRLAGAMALVVLSGLCTACISYTIGQGAETTPKSEQSIGSSINLVPGTFSDRLSDPSNGEPTRSRTSTRRPSIDSDLRFGIDDRNDIGIRLATYSGFMVTWKHQLTRADSTSKQENRARTAFMLGTGILNLGEHAGVEATLITSGKWTAAGQLYGAVRAIQVLPITSSAKHDDPVVGVAIGHLFGDRERSIGPEIGVYYDRSVLGLNTNRILVIPSLVVRGDGIPVLGRLFGRRN